jgi:hypothetical protein
MSSKPGRIIGVVVKHLGAHRSFRRRRRLQTSPRGRERLVERSRPRTRVDHLIALQTHLLGRLEAGGNTVLVIDEARNLGLGVLEHVRLLSNLEADREKLIQIVLCGQPELRQKLAHPKLSEVFGAGVEPIFYTFSGGCPRRINLLADHVLLSAYAQGQRPVTRTLVERRARELAATRALPLVKADGEES